MSNDSKIKTVEKIMEHSRKLSTWRFLLLWFIGLLVALALFLPQLKPWAALALDAGIPASELIS